MTKPWRSESSNRRFHSSRPHHRAGRVGRRADVERAARRPSPAAARRRPGVRARRAAPRLRRFGRTDSGRRPRVAGASSTVWAKANSASREPLTGSTCVAGVGLRDAVAPRQPAGDRLAQLRRAGGRRIGREAVERADQRLLDEPGVGCFGSPIDRLIGCSVAFGVAAGEQGAQLLERVGLQLVEQGVHARLGWRPANPSCDARRRRWCRCRRAR